jgi:hypothetical protein
MQQTNSKLQRTKALALVLSTLGLMLALAPSASAGAKKTYFTSLGSSMVGPLGGTLFIELVPPNGRLYAIGAGFASDEVATDSRLTGRAEIRTSGAFDLPASPSPIWGTYHLENQDGAWDGYWTGSRTAFTDSTGPHLLTRNFTTAVGSGAYKGLVVRAEVTAVDVHLPNPAPTLTTGYIIEAKGGPSERPMQSRSEGTERVEIHPGFFVAPPVGEGAMVTWEILSEVAQVSHLGRSANQGVGLLNPLTGEVSGAGALTSANGDRLYWVATGWSLGPSGPVDLTLHWVGGTGRFEAAARSIRGTLELDATGDLSLMDLSLNAQGAIRY